MSKHRCLWCRTRQGLNKSVYGWVLCPDCAGTGWIKVCDVCGGEYANQIEAEDCRLGHGEGDDVA